MNLDKLISLGFIKHKDQHRINYKYKYNDITFSVLVGDFAYSTPRQNDQNYYSHVEFAIIDNKSNFINHDSFKKLDNYFDGQIFSYVDFYKLFSILNTLIKTN